MDSSPSTTLTGPQRCSTESTSQRRHRRWVKTRSSLQSAVDSKVHVYLAGDSFGGNIAHHVAARATESSVKVLGNILLHPMFGGETTIESKKKLDDRYFVITQYRD
ncbi:hypothetical protein TIFTF001_008092 [Ficus carica]|uniref:Alpha/beta hydrolase fold-3 domain-containing protein n=1 Tax=Ficus carica TaxID=3494 RepID=A0AA88A460_FICCA|nr:hypothetical protein TIFTF001_008092 [Ficus carica]